MSGNLALNPAATMLVEVNATQNDRVHATGNAAVAGTLVVNTSAGWTANYAYTFLTAGGTVTGTFSDVIDDLPLADAELTYGSNSVSFTLVSNLVSFATLAATPDQMAVAAAAESLGSGNPVFDSLLMLDAPAAQAAFSSLSGGAYPSTASMFLLDSRFVREATLSRARGPLNTAASLVPGAPPAGQSGVWAQAFGSWGTLDGSADAASLSRTVSGVFSGIDGRIGDAVRLGFAAGYSQTSFDVSSLASSGSSDDYHVALYGGARLGLFDVRAGAAFTWHDVSANRTVAYSGFSDRHTADFSAHTGQVYAEAAIPWSFAAGALEPFANLAYVRGSTDGFTELGGASSLTAQTQTDDVVFTTLGLRGAVPFALGTIPVSARGSVGWQHAFGDLTPETQFTFASGSLPFAIDGVGLPQNALLLEGGLDFAFTANAGLSLVYSGLWSNSGTDNAFKGTFQVQF
ncbi:outer membrane autotransporter protein [Aquabacter spiritensis]|uniref:Outer membrane autotransporter protein n=1 Tax=Aquabacter spiritensis TaxID=933073 RepID=A0A4R3LNP5_9HYPH|nr:outer membrane autotransporter protein [Aquabacter spiritensis]